MSPIRSCFIAGVAVIVLGASALAQAQTTKKELTPQQQRMGECAHEGKGKKGAEYKQFMKDCLKAKKDGAAAAAPATAKTATAAPAASAAATKQAAASQKDKMKACNAQAKEKSLKGDARKSFMSDCLKA